ncbi:MAG TPA: AMP-binding protein [Acetobacteraceae bacterium]|nr:AMP-binding protein [Acetobacteraceae bacterium]
MTSPTTDYPVLSRQPHDVVYRLRGQDVTVGSFLHAAYRAAEALPDAPFVINACRQRLWFAVMLAAALLRNQVTLLCSDRTRDQVREVADRYPGLYLATDDPSQDWAVRRHVLPDEPPHVSTGVQAMPCFAATTIAAIVFTSGSTGRPAAHRKTWGSLAERSIDAAACFGFSEEHPAHIVGMVPAQHMYGFETTVLLPLHVPASTWCSAAFYPHDVAAALWSIPAPRVLVTTPLQLGALLRAAIELPPLYRIISATAPLARDLAAAAEDCWRTEVHEIFGATEVASIAHRRTTRDDFWQTYPRVRLQPTGAEDARSVSVIAPFGVPHPLNDVIELRDATHFRLLGRRSDMIKLGGRRVSLAELNRILNGIEGVIDGQFIAPPDLETQPNARLQVFAVAPQREANDILAELRHRIDPLFLPRRVVLVDCLPRNETGKLTEAAIGALRSGRPDL